MLGGRTKPELEAWLKEHRLEENLQDAINAALLKNPLEPLAFIADRLAGRFPIPNDHPALAKAPPHGPRGLAPLVEMVEGGVQWPGREPYPTFFASRE